MTHDLDKPIFPPEHVEASVNDGELQRDKLRALDDRTRKGLELLRIETLGTEAGDRITWVYFRSPDWSWAQEAGVEGWLLYDPETKQQHAFLTTAIS